MAAPSPTILAYPRVDRPVVVLGYAFGDVLPYATAGIAWGQSQLETNDPNGDVIGRRSLDHVGWTAGIGLEHDEGDPVIAERQRGREPDRSGSDDRDRQIGHQGKRVSHARKSMAFGISMCQYIFENLGYFPASMEMDGILQPQGRGSRTSS